MLLRLPRARCAVARARSLSQVRTYAGRQKGHALPKQQVGRRDHELALLPAALEITETPPSPTVRATAAIIICAFCLARVWACIGSVDIVATAQGKIIPSGRTKLIQSLRDRRGARSMSATGKGSRPARS